MSQLKQDRLNFWTGLIKLAKQKGTRHKNIKPSHRHWLPASAGVSGLAFTYVVTKKYAHVELYIGRPTREENITIFEQLKTKESEIETAFGSALLWEKLDRPRKKKTLGCRVSYRILNGKNFQNSKAEWPALQIEMLSKMGKLEQSVADVLSKIDE